MNAVHTCQFFIKELDSPMREQVISANSWKEVNTIVKKLMYRSYLIESYQPELPMVEEENTESANDLGLPHNLRLQAV